MHADQLQSIQDKWSVTLPNRFSELCERVPNATHVRLMTGELFALPFPLLSPEQIVGAFDVATDWDLPNRVVPVIGDFHHLICLDYRRHSTPSVIALDDDRKKTSLFKSIDEFIDALTTVADKPSGIIPEKIWLDF